MRINIQCSLKGLGIRRARGRRRGQQRCDQFIQQIDAGLQVVADSIPFDDREFRVVQRAALVLPERARDLIDGRRAGRDQPLHVQFGRRLEKLAACRADRLDVKLRNDFVRKQRRFDFEESALVEEFAQASAAEPHAAGVRRAMHLARTNRGSAAASRHAARLRPSEERRRHFLPRDKRRHRAIEHVANRPQQLALRHVDRRIGTDARRHRRPTSRARCFGAT